MFIYLITNLKNWKVYVGKLYHRKSLPGYWEENIRKALKGLRTKPHLYAAIRKHGAGNFAVDVLEEFDFHEELAAAETKWIHLLDSNNPEFGYNLTTGGEGNPGHKVSASARKRIGDSHRGKPLSEEHRQLLREAKLKNPTNYWLGKKRPNAFGDWLGKSATKGKKVIYIGGKRKYVSKEEYNLHHVSC
jgi:group I intron endonuclease